MKRLLPLLCLLLLAAPADARKRPEAAVAPIAELEGHNGRLRNLAQQHLYRQDVAAATATLARILATEPTDGFSHGLLAQALVFGWNLGPETSAAWQSFVDQAPDRPELVALAALAEREAHRNDRFLGPESPWFAASLDRVQTAQKGAKKPARYELQLAERTLQSFVKQHDAARAAGLAAHRTNPQGLQGRLTAMTAARVEGDLAQARDVCLSILETDPWAAEACSSLWAVGAADTPEEQAVVDGIQAEVLAAISALEDRWVADPVVANELLKFRSRIKDREGQEALRVRVEAASPGFRYLNRSRWWRSGVVIGPGFRAMNIAANKSRKLPAEQRKAALLEHWEAVPEGGGDDWGLMRYLDAVVDTAKELGDRSWQREALELRVQGRPDDADALLALAQFRATDPDDPQGRDAALRLVRRSARALAEAPWDPSDAATRRKRFFDHVVQVKSGTAVRRELEVQLGTPTILDPLPANASGWLGWADDQQDPVLALQGSLEGLSLLSPEDRGKLTRDLLTPSLDRLRAALPAIDALELDALPVLLAMAQARAVDRERRKEAGGKDLHPLVGHPAPAFVLDTLAGRTLTNEGERGRVVVVDFWATWCGPCIQEMPHLRALQERLGDAPVTFLLPSVDATEDPVAPFMKKEGYRFDTAWVGETGMKQRWQVRGIPSLFVVGPDGVVRHHHQGFRPDIGEVLEAQIRDLLRTP